MKRRILLYTILCCLILVVGFATAEIPKPEKVLGFKIGTDKKVADMHQIVDYFQRLDTASGRVVVREIGKTTLGNPFIVAIVTSEENQQNLETYRQYQQLLADPRKISEKKADEIISKGKAVVMINCSIHATEIGASQMSMQLAHDLAAKNDEDTRRILDNVILLLVPMHNPDGIQMVVDWYKKHLESEWEGSRMPWLYHKYVGHDNNRDWYMFTQIETRLTIQVHNRWHPQVVLDMHQMGNTGARLFVPPYVDPYEPNVDPILTQQVAAMGSFIASELTSQGKGGVMHSTIFDAWTPARAYHHYHGGIRILTEAASVKIATPVTIPFDGLQDEVKTRSVKMPLPWKGGRWTLKDIVDYDYSAARAVLTHAAGLRKNWLRSFYKIHKKAVERSEPPYAFLVAANQKNTPSAVSMLSILQMGGVEVYRADAAFQADGRSYPQGTTIVYTAQPYGGFAKALLEKQVYPEIRETPGGPLKTPYDVVAHTLPLLMGVDVVQIDEPFKVQTTLLKEIKKPAGTLSKIDDASCYAWGHATNDDIIALNRLIAKGHSISWTAEAVDIDGRTIPPGTMIVSQKPGLFQDMEAIIGDLYVQFEALTNPPDASAYKLKPVRLGLYKSWTASMDEGWTRWVLEQHEFPYESVFDKDIREGHLNDRYDVILFPDSRESQIIQGLSEKEVPPEYAGGIGEAGIEEIRTFVQNGGTLITLNSSSEFPIKHLYLTVENCAADLDRMAFFIPGSILRVINDPGHPIAYGYDRISEIFFRRSPVFSASEGTSVVRYPTHEPLLSGWANGDNHLFNKSAIVDVPYGQGKIILIGFPAQYRAQSQGSFRYVFNAIFYGAAVFIDGHQ